VELESTTNEQQVKQHSSYRVFGILIKISRTSSQMSLTTFSTRSPRPPRLLSFLPLFPSSLKVLVRQNRANEGQLIFLSFFLSWVLKIFIQKLLKLSAHFLLPKKLLGSGFSTPCTPFGLICTSSSELTCILICTCSSEHIS